MGCGLRSRWKGAGFGPPRTPPVEGEGGAVSPRSRGGIKAPLTAPAGACSHRLARILQDSRSVRAVSTIWLGGHPMDERSIARSDRPGEGGRAVPSRLRAADGGGGADGAAGGPAAGLAGRGQAQTQAGLQADQARRRRAAQGAVVAGADPAQPALRHRHQGPGRLAHLLRAAGRASIPTATSSRSSPPRSRAARTATLAADGTSVTWKLKKGVTWHDGKPFTADDVVFTWEYAADPATAAVTIGAYRTSTVEKVDSHTVKVDVQAARRRSGPTPSAAAAG